MFLHEDEVGKMGYNSVNNDITVIKSNDNIEGLAVEVQGKADPSPVTLMMWFDHELPEFFPVCHLLAWLKLSGIKDGFFFPDCNFLTTTIVNNPSWGGVCTEPISYADVLAAWKNLCSSILERDGKIVAHSGHKQHICLVFWGGAQDTDLMLSARHKMIKNALKYKCDASFLLALAQKNMSDLSL